MTKKNHDLGASRVAARPGQLALTKFLLLTDGSVDLRDFRSTLVYILERADFRRDLFLFANLSMDSLDYAGPRINHGSKGVLLGLGDPVRKLPTEFSGSPARPIEKVCVYAPGVLCVQGPDFESDPKAGELIAKDPALGDWPLIVLTDEPERAARSDTNFLWTTFTRFDPAADVSAASVDQVHHHSAFTPPIVIDARRKPWYPEELFCDPDTATQVDRRWKEYFPGGGVEMGDSDRGHLD